MPEIKWDYYEKCLDKVEKMFGKRENFTIEEVTDYFEKNYQARVYDDLYSMITSENIPENANQSIEGYTQYSISGKRYKCLFLVASSGIDKGMRYPLIIGYDKNGIITSFFREYGGEEGEILDVLCKNWKEDLIERHKQWEEYDKAHPLEERLKALLGEDYDKKNP